MFAIARHMLAWLCAAAVALAQQSAPAIAVRSLLPFVRSEAAPRPLTSALPGESSERSPLEAASTAAPTTWVMEVLDDRHRQAIDASRLRVAIVNRSLLIQGEDDAVQAYARDFDAMAAAFARPIEVTAMRLPLAAGELPATTWDAGTLQQRLQAAPASWTTHGRTRSGETLRLADERGIGILRDLDVEVAPDARISDPKVDVAFAGVRATVAVHALAGDEIVVTGCWTWSEPIVVREQAVGAGQASIDLPEHRTIWATFAGRVPSGGALVVAARGGAVGPEGIALVLSARFTSPPAPDPAPDLIVRAAGALLPWPTFGRPALTWPLPGEDRPGGGFPFEPIAEGIDDAGLLALLESRNPGEITIKNGIVIARGDAGACRHVEDVLQKLTATLRPAALHCRVAAAGDTVSLELVQPILAERSAAAFVGTERALLRDHEVEIAEKAQASNPVVGVAFAGLWLGACASPQRGDWHVDGGWTICAQHEPRVREHPEKVPMTMQLVDYRTAVFPWNAPMAAGREHVLGDGPPWTANGKPTQVSVRLIAQ